MMKGQLFFATFAAALVASADCGWKYDAAAGRLEQALDAAAVARGDKPWSFALKADGVLGLNARGAGAVLDLRRRTMPADAPEIRAIASIYRVGFQEEATCRELHLPETVTNIADQCFHKWKALRDVDIPATGPLVIENLAFTECPALTNVAIASAKRLGEQVFYFDAALEGVRLPENLEEIGKSCFWGCKALKTVTPFLPKTIRRIGRDAFRSCPSIESPLEIGFGRDAAGNPIRVEKLPEWACYECRKIPSVKYGPGVRDVGQFLCASCDSVGSIEFGANVTNVEDTLGATAQSLTNVVFRRTEDISLSPKANVFQGCTKVRELTLGGWMDLAQAGGAFAGWVDLQGRIVIPGDNVKWAAWLADETKMTPWKDCPADVRKRYYADFGKDAREPAGATVAVPGKLPRLFIVKTAAELTDYPLLLKAPDAAYAVVSASPAPLANGAYAKGTRVSVTLKTLPGTSFVGWEGDVAAADAQKPTVTVTMDRVRKLAASVSRTWRVAPNGDDANDGASGRPVATVARAVELAKSSTGVSHEILFADGTYFVEKTIDLDEAAGRFVFRAEHPGKAILTGAVSVKGWTRDPKDARFLAADFPFEPGEGCLYVLVANGRMADFSAYPRFGGERHLPYIATSADAAKGNYTHLVYDVRSLPSPTAYKDLDLTSVFLFIPQEWASTSAYILTNDWKHGTFDLKTRTGMPIGQFNNGYQILNARVGMRHPGCWMFEASRKKVYYWPREGETAETLVTSISKTQNLFNLVRTDGVDFSGLVLEGCMMTSGGSDMQGCIIGADLKNSRVEDCEIRNTAGAGVYFARPVRCALRRCHVHDVGACGIRCWNGGAETELSDCDVHDNGRFHLSCEAVGIQQSQVRIVGNHVHHAPGCGILLWTQQTEVISNEFDHTMQSIRDGGGVYGGMVDSLFKDNFCHDCGDWPGLYNDEGGQNCVYTGNRFEDCWWPFHMHDCRTIVVTNNVMRCPQAMRYSFQGSVHCVFKDNVIETDDPITEDPFLESCDVWDNEVRSLDENGVRRTARVMLPRKPLPRRAPCVALPMRRPAIVPPKKVGDELDCRDRLAFRTQHFQWVRPDRDRNGLRTGGVPGAWVRLGYDDRYLYFDGDYIYNQLSTYDGCITRGHEWGRHDGVRFRFKGLTVDVFVDGTIASSDPALVFTPTNSYAKYVGGTGAGCATYTFRIPLARLGLDPATMVGTRIPFNVIFYNADHDEYMYVEKPGADDLTAEISLDPYYPPYLAYADPKAGADIAGDPFPGPLWPRGRIRLTPQTAAREDEPAAAPGYDNRHEQMGGYLAMDCASRLAGFLMLPYTGPDKGGVCPQQHVEKASEGCSPGFYAIQLERWAMETETTTSPSAGYLRIGYDRGGIVKLYIDTQVCAETKGGELSRFGTVVEEASSVSNGVFEGFVRFKAGDGQHRLWTRTSFLPAPRAVRKLEGNGRTGARYILEFKLKSGGSIFAKTVLSAESAASAAAAFASAPGLTGADDFSARRQACADAWFEILKNAKGPTDEAAMKTFYTDLYRRTAAEPPATDCAK